MPCTVGEARFAQLNVPVVFTHQRVGVAKAKGVIGFSEGYGSLICGAELF